MIDLFEAILDSQAKWPSTGFFAIAAAVAIARQAGARAPAVYGFGACPRCGAYYRCNFENQGASERDGKDGYHAFGKERLGRRPPLRRSCHVMAAVI